MFQLLCQDVAKHKKSIELHIDITLDLNYKLYCKYEEEMVQLNLHWLFGQSNNCNHKSNKKLLVLVVAQRI